jgi:hypothetical protein
MYRNCMRKSVRKKKKSLYALDKRQRRMWWV